MAYLVSCINSNQISHWGQTSFLTFQKKLILIQLQNETSVYKQLHAVHPSHYHCSLGGVHYNCEITFFYCTFIFPLIKSNSYRSENAHQSLYKFPQSTLRNRYSILQMVTEAYSGTLANPELCSMLKPYHRIPWGSQFFLEIDSGTHEEKKVMTWPSRSCSASEGHIKTTCPQTALQDYHTDYWLSAYKRSYCQQNKKFEELTTLVKLHY